MTTSILCLNCIHYLGDLSCLAFDEIPTEIVTGANNHSEIQPDQVGEFIFLDKSESIEEFFSVRDAQ